MLTSGEPSGSGAARLRLCPESISGPIDVPEWVHEQIHTSKGGGHGARFSSRICGGYLGPIRLTLARLELCGKLPSGGVYHVAGPTDDGFRVVDVWESQEDFDRFFEEKLHAALEAEGMPAPNVSTWPVHNTMTG